MSKSNRQAEPTPAPEPADLDPTAPAWAAWTAQLTAELEAEVDTILEDLLHPQACPWCGRPFDDSGGSQGL